jgi:hypothetical protein
MFTTEKTSNFNIIKDFYYLDANFISCFPSDINHSVDLCVNKSLKDFSEYKDLEFYKILNNSSCVGYFAITPSLNSLVTFFLNPNDRNKETKEYLWNQIKIKLKSPFYLSMVGRNPRVISYYKKLGGQKIFEYNLGKDMIHVFKFEGDFICR